MGQKHILLILLCITLLGIFPMLYAQGTTIGGHVKLTAFDVAKGDHNDVSGDQYIGMGMREMILYFSQELSDKVSIDLQPFWDASTGATPKFGKDIGEQKTAAGSVDPKFHGWIKAVVKTLLPGGYELSAGIVKPRFTMEYGAENFWQDEFNGGKFSCDNYLGAMHDTGVEIYKSFEFNNLSLPTYIYLLNGGYEFSDNNKGPMGMIHVEPEFGALRLTGSAAFGKYDNDGENSVTRFSAGAAYDRGPFAFRAEYACGNWANSIVTASDTSGNPTAFEDAKPSGLYAKVFYRFAPWGRLMLHYDLVDHNFAGFFYTALGSEKYSTITPGFQLNVSESSIIQIQYDMANWQQKDKYGIPGQKDELKFNRLTVGWRTTF